MSPAQWNARAAPAALGWRGAFLGTPSTGSRCVPTVALSTSRGMGLNRDDDQGAGAGRHL
jgi:hypothetical protein